jgi:glutathione S-transferase
VVIDPRGAKERHDGPMARATLYGTPGSHPSLSAELMLRHKGIDYRRHDLPNMTHKHLLPLLRFSGSTVPVLKLDGERITTTKGIARALEAAQPQPPMLPVDEAVEAWADDALQDCVRMLGRWAAPRDRASMATFVEGAKLGLPVAVVKATLPVIGPLTARQMRIGDDVARERLAALPGHLDRVDALIADGQIGGAQPNVLDFQIAPSVRLAMAFDQLRPHVAPRPAGVHALRVAPDYPGRFGPVFPAEWMPF